MLYYEDSNGNGAEKKTNILRKSLADGPSVNLRQLYNSNMTEVQLQH